MKSIPARLTLATVLSLTLSCGPEVDDVSGADGSPSEKQGQNQKTRKKLTVDTAVSLKRDFTGFSLIATATAYTISLEGCASGYTSTANETSPDLQVYRHDKGCLAKLTSFQYNSITWQPSTGDPFETWQPGDTATFEDSTDSTNTILVKVESQLADPVTGTEAVTYKFSEINPGNDENIGQDVVGDGHTMTVSGQQAPSFTVNAINYVGMTETGGGQFQFTMECTETLSGTAPDYTCIDVTLSDIQYKLVEDTYGGTLTISEASSLFSSGATAVTPSDDAIDPGQNGVTNGGFMTKGGGSVLSGPDQMHNNPNMILIFEAAGTSYLYFNVDVTTLTQG